MPTDEKNYRAASEVCSELEQEIANSGAVQPGLPADFRIVTEYDGVLVDFEMRKKSPCLVDAIASDLTKAQSLMMEGLVKGTATAEARQQIGWLSSRIGMVGHRLKRPAGAPQTGYYSTAQPASFSAAEVPQARAFLLGTATLLQKHDSLPSFPTRMSAGRSGRLQCDLLISLSGPNGYVARLASLADIFRAQTAEIMELDGVDPISYDYLSRACEKVSVDVAYSERMMYAHRPPLNTPTLAPSP